MISLPFKLSGRSKLLGEEVASVFAPLVTLINGGLTARNFARRAGIRNAQKAEPYSYAIVQASSPRIVAAPCTIKLAALAPRDRGWICAGLRFHLQSYAGLEGGPYTAYSGDFLYGGSGRDHSVAFDASGWSGLTSLVSATGDFADPDTGNVLAEVDVAAGNGPYNFILTAIFKTPHQR